VAALHGALKDVRNHIVGRTMTSFGTTALDEMEHLGVNFFSAQLGKIEPATHAFAGLAFTDVPPQWTFPGVYGGYPNSVFWCNNPGTLVAYAMSTFLDLETELYCYLNHSGPGAAAIANTNVMVESPRNLSSDAFFSTATTTFTPDESFVTDIVKIPLSSSSGWDRHGKPVLYSGYTSLVGQKIEYPASWTAGMVLNVDNLFARSYLTHVTYGRGLYYGSATARYNMPVMLPGSGDELEPILDSSNILPDYDAEPARTFPTEPGEPVFAPSNRKWSPYDHGGPLAHIFYGLHINPNSDEYAGRITMQISGGPTSGTYDLNKVDGTAIDSFWPSGRPILPRKR
jgi:hypothetical protein